MIKSYIKTFTPEEALDIVMNHNENYRKLNQTKALEYAKVMKAGKWEEENGETIGFYENGNLANGQHRLYAMSKAGVSLTFLVVEGIKNNATTTIDVGFKRSSEDAIRYTLRDTGKEFIHGAFSITKQVMQLRKQCKLNEQSPYKVGLTELEVREDCLDDIDGYNEAALFGKQIMKESKVIKKNEAGSIYYYLTHDMEINPWYVKDYFNKLLSAARNDKTIFNTTITNLSMKVKSSDRYDELIWGWNSYIRGNTTRRCPYSGWFERPNNKAFYTKDTVGEFNNCIGVGLTEEEASEAVLVREIS